MKRVIRFWFLFLLGDSNAVVPLSFLISEKSTALPHSHVEARGCLQFLCKAISLRAVFLSARCTIKNRNHEPQRELGVGPLGAFSLGGLRKKYSFFIFGRGGSISNRWSWGEKNLLRLCFLVVQITLRTLFEWMS